MGASKNFYTELQEKEQYANVSMKIDVFASFKRMYDDELDYTVNHIKQKNKSHKDNEQLINLYKQKSKLTKEITKIEQKLNHDPKANI